MAKRMRIYFAMMMTMVAFEIKAIFAFAVDGNVGFVTAASLTFLFQMFLISQVKNNI